MIPEWMLLLEMTKPERVAYLSRKAEAERYSRINQPSDHKKKS